MTNKLHLYQLQSIKLKSPLTYLVKGLGKCQMNMCMLWKTSSELSVKILAGMFENETERNKQSFQTGEGLILVITLKTWVKERESPTSISISQQFWNRKQTCSIVRIYNFRANFMIMHPSTLKNTWGQSSKYRAEHEMGENSCGWKL